MVKMPLKWRKERGGYYEDRIIQTRSYHEAVIKRRDKFREIYNREPGGFDAETPWQGASNIHLPLVLEKVETAAPKIVSAMWRAEPFVNVRRPGGKDGTQDAKNIEQFLTWAFRNDIPEFYRNFENYQRNRLVDPVALAKIRWLRKWRRTIETHTLDSTIEEKGVILDRTEEELFHEIFNFGDAHNTYLRHTQKGGTFTIEFNEAGIPHTATATIHKAERLGEIVVKVIRDVIENDSPIIENVDMEDLVFPERSRNLQDAEWVAHKTWYSIEELRRKKKAGVWQITEKDIQYAQGIAKRHDDDNQGESNKDNVVGISGMHGKQVTTKDGKIDPNKVLVWELYCKDYVDGSDEPVDVILHILDRARVIIGVEYHDEIFPHGRRPFIHDNYIPVDGRIYGISMAEVLYGINLSINKTINEVHNGMAIKTNPWFLYSVFGMAENASLLNGIQPGEGVPVGDVNAVRFPDFAQNPAEAFHSSFETMRGYADSLTFSPAIGGSSNYRNAPRTARGTLALMDAAEEKLGSLVEQSQAMSWKEMVRQVTSLYGRYVGIDKWYPVTGESNPRRVSPKELRENLNYSFSGSLTSVNRDVQRSLVERKYVQLRTDELYRTDPKAHQALIREYAEAFTEVGDANKIVPKLPGEGGMPHPPWQQSMELLSISAGHDIEVLPIDDHVQHLREIESYKKSDMYKNLDSRATTLIEVHERAHKKLAQQAAQQGGSDGQQGGQAGGDSVAAEGVPSLGGELSASEGGPQS